MAGDFVVIQFATARKIEVHRIAAALGVTRSHAFGLCVETWIWFDEQTEDGVAKGATCDMLDGIVGVPGFSKALSDVGWLRVRDSSLELPNFDRLMGKSAKKRINDALRKRNSRDAKTSEVDDAEEDSDDEQETRKPVVTASQKVVTHVTKRADENVTLQNRTEQINTLSLSGEQEPVPPLRTWKHPPGASQAVCDAIDVWQRHQSLASGRPDNDVQIEISYKQCLAAGWDQDKIARSIPFSIHKHARSWIDPDDDYQRRQPKASKAPRPSVDISKLKV